LTIAIVIGSTIGRTEITVRAIAAVVVGTAKWAAEGVGVGEVLLEEEKEEKRVHRERGSGDRSGLMWSTKSRDRGGHFFFEDPFDSRFWSSIQGHIHPNPFLENHRSSGHN